MHACLCKTNALEVFLTELTGLRLRTFATCTRAPRLARCRGFQHVSSDPQYASHRSLSTQAYRSDDGFSPFAYQDVRETQSPTNIARRSRAHDSVSNIARDESRHSDEELARRQKRLAKKLKRVADGTFGPNKQKKAAPKKTASRKNVRAPRHPPGGRWQNTNKKPSPSVGPARGETGQQKAKRATTDSGSMRTGEAHDVVTTASSDGTNRGRAIEDLDDEDLTVGSLLKVTKPAVPLPASVSFVDEPKDTSGPDVTLSYRSTRRARMSRRKADPSSTTHGKTSEKEVQATPIEPEAFKDGQEVSQVAADTNQSAGAQTKRERLPWQIKKEAMREVLGPGGWQPRKRISPDSLNGIRALHDSDPELYTIFVLGKHLGISPEAVRRILKSRWRPRSEEIEDRRKRWELRGKKKRREINEHKRRAKTAKVVRKHDTRQALSRM